MFLGGEAANCTTGSTHSNTSRAVHELRVPFFPRESFQDTSLFCIRRVHQDRDCPKLQETTLDLPKSQPGLTHITTTTTTTTITTTTTNTITTTTNNNNHHTHNNDNHNIANPPCRGLQRPDSSITVDPELTPKLPTNIIPILRLLDSNFPGNALWT